MIAELQRWDATDSHPRALMMSGTGGKAFCAGGDIVSIYKAHTTEGADKSCKAEFFAREFLLDFTLSQMKKTRQISLWNGICMGGGVGLTWHSPVRIATDNSMYAMPETAIGFFCDVGGSYFLSRVKNDISLGLYLGLTGQRVKSRDLVKWGLATHFVESSQVPELYTRLQDGVTAQSSDSDIDGIVASLSDSTAEAESIDNIEEIQEIFQPDSVQEVVKRLNASETEFAVKTRKMMKYMSPLSLAIVFEQIKRGSTMEIEDVFSMEYGIT